MSQWDVQSRKVGREFKCRLSKCITLITHRDSPCSYKEDKINIVPEIYRMGGFITKNCPLAIYFQFRFYKSCTCHVFYVWKRMTWIDKWPYFSRSFTREPQFLKEKWSPPSSRPGERKMLFFFFFFGKKKEDYNSERRWCFCSSRPWRWANLFDFSKSQREGTRFPAVVLCLNFNPFLTPSRTWRRWQVLAWEESAALGHGSDITTLLWVSQSWK